MRFFIGFPHFASGPQNLFSIIIKVRLDYVNVRRATRRVRPRRVENISLSSSKIQKDRDGV